MKVKVDRNLCVGATNCVFVAPSVFQLDDEGKAIIIDPASVDDAKLMEAAESCPTKAIILEDDEGQPVYP